MTIEGTFAKGIRGDFHRPCPDPVARLAYFRCVARRLREGKETRLRLREG